LSFIPIFLPLMAAIVAINYLMAKLLGRASALNDMKRLVTISAMNVAQKLKKTPSCPLVS